MGRAANRFCRLPATHTIILEVSFVLLLFRYVDEDQGNPGHEVVFSKKKKKKKKKTGLVPKKKNRIDASFEILSDFKRQTTKNSPSKNSSAGAEGD